MATRISGNTVSNTLSSGATAIWRMYADYETSSTETAYTITAEGIGVKNAASKTTGAKSIGFGANTLTASYSGAFSMSHTREAKITALGASQTANVYSTPISATIVRTKVAQQATVTYTIVCSPSSPLAGTSSKVVEYDIPARSSHTISYNANGGTGTIASQTKFYSDSGETDYYETLSDGSGFTKSGCELVGWNTQSDGSGTSYSLSEVYTVNGTTDITLYAQWSSNDSGVRVRADGTWHKGELSVKVNGAWASGTLYKKVNGNWVQ